MYTFAHVEIPTTDLNRAVSFYHALFEWKFDHFYGEDYRMISTSEGVQVGGLTLVKEIPRIVDFYNYVEVKDVETAMVRAERAGGIIIRPKTELPAGHGAYAVIQCPDGYRIGVWAKG